MMELRNTTMESSNTVRNMRVPSRNLHVPSRKVSVQGRNLRVLAKELRFQRRRSLFRAARRVRSHRKEGTRDQATHAPCVRCWSDRAFARLATKDAASTGDACPRRASGFILVTRSILSSVVLSQKQASLSRKAHQRGRLPALRACRCRLQIGVNYT